MSNFCVDTGDLIAKLADADAEIKRLEAEVERLTDAMSFTESKALDRVAELEGKLKNLRCCGNCTYFYDVEQLLGIIVHTY
jgi:hypothetical protein